jgi:serine/threonine protein kinase/tetratricopeptide (TPR) repeat protein
MSDDDTKNPDNPGVPGIGDTLHDLATALGDRYTIRDEIGRGATGVVYLAEDLKHRRRVAVKVVRRDLATNLAADRFLREIEIAATLRHPHILSIHDSGQADDLIYYVMPYVDGEALRTRLEREGPLPIEEAVTIACEVAEALDYAHRQDVVHRDVKPENVLLEEGHAVVLDFGVARGIGAASTMELTAGGMAVGTPAYMSPEQACGSATVDGRSDQYSLACLLYEMLTGQPPFLGIDARAVLARHLLDDVPPLTTLRKDVPLHIRRAVVRALQKTAADRFRTAKEFGEALAAPATEGDDAALRSLAVLPFANLSGLPDDEYLSDGLTEELINALSKLEGLSVVSRTAVFALKESTRDVREIAERLNVGSVLEGSVRRAGSRLRVTARLIDVADGYNRWSERYDREMADVFAIQDEITDNIVRALRVILSDAERQALARVPTADISAYEQYLRGRQYFHHRRKKSLEFAREMFYRAIEIDPDFALAHAGVADCCSLLVHWYGETDEATLAEADAASQKALELNPDLAEAHAARGIVLWQMGQPNESEAEFETAIRLDPRQFNARYFHAREYYEQGRLEEAVRLFEEASQVRDDHEARYFAAQTYTALGYDDEADAAYRRALPVIERHLALNPDDARAVTMGAVCLSRLGHRTAGLEWAERAHAIDPDDGAIAYNVACLYALERETDKALDFLEASVGAGFGNRDWMENDPDLESLRDHPRFKAIPWRE